MDNQSVVTVRSDQAVFTSIRSPMGEGYRLIAAGPAVSSEERAEITRMCPSHGGLADEAAGFVGLLSWRLNSGRHAIGYCCHAGLEQTGRGGSRIYTHLALLDRAAFARYQFDPVRVHAALGRAIGSSRILSADTNPAPLELTIPDRALHPPFPIDAACEVIAGLLANQWMIVSGAAAPLETLQWLLGALPASTRESLGTTIGLKFSPGRRTSLTFLQGDPTETRRIIRGHDIHWLDLAAPAAHKPWPFNGWMDLVYRRWREGRYQEVVELADRLSGSVKPADLDRIASVCNDIDQIQTAHAPLLERLIIKYAGFTSQNESEADLVKRLRAEAKTRAANLQKAQNAMADEVNAPQS